jgi:hypothetical protein
MAQNAGLVLATRQARMLTKDYAAANALPALTIDFNGDWGAGWNDAGLTNGGIGTTISVDRGSIPVDQLFYDVLRPITGAAVRFDTNLAQFSPENLLRASGIGAMADAVAPGAGTRGSETYEIAADFDDPEISVGWEAVQRNGEAFRAIVPRGIPVSSPNPRVGQADTNAQIAFEVEALPPDDFEDHNLAEFVSVIPATS